MSFPDREKLLKEVVFSLAVSKELTCTIYRPGKTFEKWPRVKSYLLKYATIKKHPISTLPKNLRWYELRWITSRPDLYNLKSRKS